MEYESIEWLNLELAVKSRNITTIDRNKIVCHFEKQFKHELHGENRVENSLVDLLISLGESLDFHQQKVYRILESATNILFKTKSTCDSILKNLEYIKSQNDSILAKTKQNSLAEDDIKRSISSLILEISQEPKAIEKESKIILEKAEEKILQVEALLIEIKKIVIS